MKKSILLCALLICICLKSKAQQTIPYADFRKHIGKTATLCDTVYTFKIVNDSLTLINMGGMYPDQKFTVAVKGHKISLDWVNLKRKHLCVTGVLELYKNTLQIVVFEPNQVTVSQ